MPESDLLTVNVDESGDAGTLGRGTRWLVLAGVAETGSRGTLRAALVDIARRLHQVEPYSVHFSGINRPNAQHAAMAKLAGADFTAIVVASDTKRVRPDDGLAEPSVHYRYALKLLFERASQLAAQEERRLEFVIESSGHFDLEAFRQYLLRSAERPHPLDRTNWAAADVSRVRTSPKSDNLLLSAADGMAYAFLRALEPPPGWDVATPQFAELLQHHLWRGAPGSRVLHNGLVLLPTSETPALLREFPHLRRWSR